MKRGKKTILVSRTAFFITLAALSACGGSGSETQAETQQRSGGMTASLSANSGIDFRSLNLLPMPDNGRWEYERSDSSGEDLGIATRTVQVLRKDANTTFLITVADGEDDYTEEVIRNDTGILSHFAADASLPPKVRAAIGGILEYAFQTYFPGGVRRITRQGEWDRDMDGDGINDTFTLEYVQTYHGFASVETGGNTMPHNTVTAAKFSNVYRLSIIGSGTGRSDGFAMQENAYLAPGIGAVRYEYSFEDHEGNPLGSSEIWTLTRTQNVKLN
jgi:hypothetical protein